MKSAISDKKIFYGLVTLIVLTILLVVGISFIQRPQTTSSDAQFQEPLTQQITQDGETAAPTSIPLVPDEETFVDSGPDQQQIEGNTPTESVGEATGDTGTESQVTSTPNSGSTETDPGTVEIVDNGSPTGEPDSPTTIPDPTNEPASSSTSEETTITDTPTPTETLLASGNETSSEVSTSGGSTLDDPEPTTAIGGGTSGTEIAYSTSTPVPTASDQLPVAGAAHVTILLLGASLMLVVLGFILT